MTQFDAATLAQVDAANPHENTWVMANAGSGKTRVLTDRVARLLFHGTLPERILCLTYTKAAASEMQNRLYNRLGAWAMMPDEDLIKALHKLGEQIDPSDYERLRFARTLFAAALETPGGLKIQTIHSFCDAILRQFPLEANVFPQFQILEDRKAIQFRIDVLEQMANGGDLPAMDAFARYYTKGEEQKFLSEVIQNRDGFKRAPYRCDFNLSHDKSIDDLREELIASCESLLKELLAITDKSESKGDATTNLRVKSALSGGGAASDLKNLEKVFLVASRGYAPKTGGVPTQKSAKKEDPIRASLDDLATRISELRKERVAILGYNRALALHKFSRSFLREYDQRKTEQGVLDYDDLIRKTNGLLHNSATAQWILYRLDGGLDHILVDEAQDTSPMQWSIIERLAEEFTAHEEDPDRPRTLFIVGDEKQSIYSFQGADPVIFDSKKKDFQAQLRGIESDLLDKALLYSFRSAAPILTLVDEVFRSDSGLNEHLAFYEDMPGRVELWPAIIVKSETPKLPWHQPAGLIQDVSPNRLLAKKIAKFISDTIDKGQSIEVEENGARIKRSVLPADFLILFQTRSKLFHELIRALKAENLPVAGADRLNIGDELAVRDIMSLLRFINTADDDLSLAEAMRSPIFGLSESDLFKLAYDRDDKKLWQIFRDSAKYPDALEIVNELRKQVDFARPYELIEQILTKHKGRENLVARLGHEVEDAIDELLTQAMVYESTEPPSLTGFLQWMSSGDVVIKREMDTSASQIRIMTVHGAKGLEAPIVILPDTIKRSQGIKDDLAQTNDMAIWRSNAEECSETQSDVDQDTKAKDHAEAMRLLYVALTRAESWLIVCGATTEKVNDHDWYKLVSDAIESVGTNGVLQNSKWEALTNLEPFKPVAHESKNLPSWLIDNAPTPKPYKKMLSPSKLSGAKSLPNDKALSEEEAKIRGTKLHLLLEHLPTKPKEHRTKSAANLLDESDEDIIEEALAILENPELAFLFEASSMAEIPISAPIGDENMFGYIDRLIVEDTRVLAVDFKSNAGIPKNVGDIPAGILAQMGAYASALSLIYPNKKIETAILWTKVGEFMSVPHNRAIEAFNTALALDQLG